MQSPNLYTFDIRKFSLFRVAEKLEIDNIHMAAANRWFHFPQRTDIAINLFRYSKKDSSFHISVTWKGTILDQTYWNQDTNNFISLIAKYPSVGFKQMESSGKLIKRFQVSFNSRKEYDECCKCVEDVFKIPLNKMDNQSKIEDSQIIDYPQQGQTQRPPNNATSHYNPSNPDSSRNMYQQYVQSQHVSIPSPHLQMSRHLEQSSYVPIQPKPPPLAMSIPRQLQSPRNTQNQVNHTHEQKTLLQLPSNYYPADSSFHDRNRIPLVSSQTSYAPESHWKHKEQRTDAFPGLTNPQLATSQITYNRQHVIDNPLGTYQKNSLNSGLSENIIPVYESKTQSFQKVLPERSKITGNQIPLPTKKQENLSVSKIHKPKPEIRLLDMDDRELKKLIILKLKDKEFVKLVERLDKIVSQP